MPCGGRARWASSGRCRHQADGAHAAVLAQAHQHTGSTAVLRWPVRSPLVAEFCANGAKAAAALRLPRLTPAGCHPDARRPGGAPRPVVHDAGRLTARLSVRQLPLRADRLGRGWRGGSRSPARTRTGCVLHALAHVQRGAFLTSVRARARPQPSRRSTICHESPRALTPRSGRQRAPHVEDVESARSSS